MGVIKASQHAAVNRYSKDKLQGFSRFELAVVICLFSILFGVFLQRFMYLQAYAEKTSMEMTIMNIRAGLRNRVSSMMMENKMQDLPSLLQENPIGWLARPPANYLGEIAKPDNNITQLSYWYFDTQKKQLVYRLNSDYNFLGFEDSYTEARYKTVALTQYGRRDGVEVKSVVGVRFDSTSDH